MVLRIQISKVQNKTSCMKHIWHLVSKLTKELSALISFYYLIFTTDRRKFIMWEPENPFQLVSHFSQVSQYLTRPLAGFVVILDTTTTYYLKQDKLETGKIGL